MDRVNGAGRTGASLVVLAAILAAAAAGAGAAQGRDLFDEIYARGTAQQRTMQSLRARFTETTTSTLLTTPIVAHGTVVAAGPARVRMTYTDPEAKTLTMDGRTLTIVWPARGERQQINISETQKRVDQYFTHASAKELRSMFDIAARPDAARPGHDLVDMRPTRKQIAQGLSRLELWIDRRSDLLTRMRLTFPGGDEKTIALEEITLNVPVTEAMFRQDE